MLTLLSSLVVPTPPEPATGTPVDRADSGNWGRGEWLQHALLLTTLLPSYPPHHPFPRAGQDSDPEEALHAQAHLHLSVLPLAFFLYCSWTRAGSGRSASCAARVCLSFFCPQRLQRALRLDPRRSAYPPPQPAPNCKEPRRASALGPTPGGPFRPRKGARRSPSKACVFPHVATRPALKSKARKEEEKSLTFLGLNKSLEQGLNLSRS